MLDQLCIRSFLCTYNLSLFVFHLIRFRFLKKIEKEKQAAALPTRSDEPGFSWFKKRCALECVDCGIDIRFHAEGPITPVEGMSSFTHEKFCNCEFDCRNDDGLEIAVVV